MRVLVVEDDEHIAGPLAEGLRRFGHEVRHLHEGGQAVAFAREADFVLLDLGLPDLDGHEVCRRLRENSSVPVIAVTAREDELDRVLLLQEGADDYVVKPYSLRELLARMEAVCRRARGNRRCAGEREPGCDGAAEDEDGTDAGAGRAVRRYGPLVVDARARRATVDGRAVELTRREFDLLAALMSDAGAVRLREDLINEVWDTNWYGSTRTLDVHVGTLRGKLGHRQWIRAVRGVGFRLALPGAA
ncbi:response regulator transcription factor [Streptomyces daliensis]|uniref:Response regulator transcription factor n=1 Tax=Streptomyces daliensis TaxID=299421 RepID=A0A8T4J0G8_9ACTN|nr:response regulator transcription factor [Streptomyces daliensis]